MRGNPPVGQLSKLFCVVAIGVALAAVKIPPLLAQDNSQPATSSSGSDSTQDSGEKKDAVTPGMTRLRIRVTTDTDKAIPNASVYVRFNTPGGFLHHDKLAEMNFKTNQDGSVRVPEVPQGKILIQVIATGWHTYGQWYDVEKDQESINIKLVPPPHWY